MSARVPAPLAALVAEVKSYAAEHGQPGEDLAGLVVSEAEHDLPELARLETCRALAIVARYLRAECERLEACPPPSLALATWRAGRVAALTARLRALLDALPAGRLETGEAPQPAA